MKKNYSSFKKSSLKQSSVKKLSLKKVDRELRRLTTETINSASANLDEKSALDIVRIINHEDAKVAAAVKSALPQIAKAVDMIASAIEQGGRLIYVGTGTSGRIAALDAVECPPTFDVSSRTVQFIIAGGAKALSSAVESNEDSQASGRKEIAKRSPDKGDVVVAIAASGRTPFTIAALQYARKRGAKTVALVCNRRSPLGKAAHLEIVAEVGPEVVAGSTRMKAGTAQKMILNMLSTGAMARLGYVYGNLMVNVHTRNAKLAERAGAIVELVAGVDRKTAVKALLAAHKNLPLAIVMAKMGVSKEVAAATLTKSGGRLRRSILPPEREIIQAAKRKGRS